MELVRDSDYTRIKHQVGRAIADYGLIDEGDRVAVGVSGGKDSYALLHILEELRRRAPVRFELTAVTVDVGFPGFDGDWIASYLAEAGFRHHLEQTDHYAVIGEKRRPGSSYCSMCARLKRGALYSVTERLGCNKLALGHHLDDFIETLLLNQFFVGSLKAMAPRMLADNGRITVIRPLVYVEERAIITFARTNGFRTVSCACPARDGVDLQRQRMKRLLTDLEREIPAIRRSLLRALANVQPRHLLDQRLLPT